MTLALTEPSELVIILPSNVFKSAMEVATLALDIGKLALPEPVRNIEYTPLRTLILPSVILEPSLKM